MRSVLHSVFLLFPMLLGGLLHAQLSCVNCTGRDTTRYTNGMENDSLYFICMGETASLSVVSPDGQPLDFQWYRFINTSNSWLSTVLTPSAVSSSYNATLGGFRVVGTDGSGMVRIDEICWVSRINQAPIVNANTLQPGCTNLTLSAVYFPPNITGYYNPPPSNPNLPYIIDSTSEISICLNIAHPILSDLSIALISPEACGSDTVLLTPAQVTNEVDTVCYNSDATALCFTTESSASYDLCSLPNYEVTGQFGAYGNPAIPIDWSVLEGCQANQAGWHLVVGDCLGGAQGLLESATMHIEGTGSDLLQAIFNFESSDEAGYAIADDGCASGAFTTVPLALQPSGAQAIANSFGVSWSADPPFAGVNGSSLLTIYLTPGPTTDTHFSIELLGPRLNGACAATTQDIEFFDYIQPDSTIISYSDSVLCLTDEPMLLTSSISEGQWQGAATPVDGGVLLDPQALGVGEWVVTYRPNSYCIDSSSVTILVDQAANVVISAEEELCATDAPLQLNAQPLGGVWHGEAVTDSLTGIFNPSAVSGLSAFVTYTSSGNCPATDTLQLTIQPALAAAIVESDTVVCRSAAPINFDANLSPGFWSGSGITGAAQGLFDPAQAGVGEHWVTYHHTGACESLDSTLVVVEDPSIVFIQPANVCLDSDPIDLEVTADEGLWTGNGLTDALAGIVDPALLSPGEHFFTFTLSNSCASVDSIGLTIEDFPQIVIDLPEGVCASSNEFTLLANLTGGAYSGTGVQSVGGLWQFSPTDAGIGTAVIQYDYSDICTVTVYDSLEVYPLPELVVSSDTSICPEGQAQLLVSGAFQYGWAPASTLSNPTQAGTTATPDVTTTYTVSGQSAQGCFSMEEVIVTVYDSPVPLTNSPVELCPGESGVLEVQGLATAQWVGQGIENPTELSTLVTPDTTAVYTVQGVDDNGCMGEAEVDVIVYEPMALFEASDTLGIPPLEVVFTNLSEGDYFIWEMGNGDTIVTTSVSEVVSTEYYGEYTYDVTLTAYLNGCSATFSDQVMTYYDSEFLLIPNVVTMGGNGKNDTWRIITQNMAEMEVIIFDRWGKKVGELNRPDAQWNPKNSGAGTYFYTLHALGLDDVAYTFEGSFTVLEDE